MSFQSELQKTKDKGSDIPFNSNITSILFIVTAGIYFLNASYLYWFTKNPEISDVISTASLGIMFLGIGASFWVTKSNG
jgi:RsiW-degrading membrane proteinase PrsW (M82 family)